ncbi:MAG TPA: D-glycero-beta-D-manno-heptose 1-phosphate adenylyltransferase [Rhizomicrobium sp.]|jgi:D-beta-D-heptose 7-phosphate kinase/D-beta-D-heptose 1-phosphate adenosyltransferase|nr:D-glycero-beta-D-manno-heptose 1-phosphate adenylyltransferase [Rhizomicrobium sp.]
MSSLELLSRFKDARVLVVGDVMLDRFVYARVSRISPEAPVPVLAVEREALSLGGAGNVARNIASLGGHATLLAGKGKDEAGAHLDELLSQDVRIQNALVTSAHGRTTEKIRYIADRQQVMRADYETAWAHVDEGQILATARAAIRDHHAMVISDYAKGFLSPALIKGLIALGHDQGKPVIVDPKGAQLAHYDGATVITPNKQEAANATSGEADSDAGAAACAKNILAGLPQLSAVMITRGPAGLSLMARGGGIVHIAARSREVFDVSGAGDTVVAALSLALAAGSDLIAAATLANIAAGIAVTMVGTAAVTADELAGELHAQQLESAEKKIVSSGRAQEWLKLWRAKGQRIGFTNGCFDLVHPGHISLLGQARAKCDRLVVGLNSDASVKQLKGAGRPVQDEMARAIVLASLAMVDLVVIFGEETPEALIHALRPEILVKGADYKRADIVGADFVTSYGGEVVLADLVPEQSTSSLIHRARE